VLHFSKRRLPRGCLIGLSSGLLWQPSAFMEQGRFGLVLSQTRILLAYTKEFALTSCWENQRLSAALVTGNRAEKYLYFEFATCVDGDVTLTKYRC
jgi:hypothetical protein